MKSDYVTSTILVRRSIESLPVVSTIAFPRQAGPFLVILVIRADTAPIQQGYRPFVLFLVMPTVNINIIPDYSQSSAASILLSRHHRRDYTKA